MTTILHLDSSARGEESVSRKLTAHIMEKLRPANPGATVLYRDLTANPIPHANPEFIAGAFKGVANDALALSDGLVKELMSADILVIGAPMYNFNIPSQLKAWLDHVCLAKKTFQYTEKGPIGLLNGKRALIGMATGGFYSEGDYLPYDHVSPYLKQILGFIGITDVQIARAQKQSMGPEIAAEQFNVACKEIDGWFYMKDVHLI